MRGAKVVVDRLVHHHAGAKVIRRVELLVAHVRRLARGELRLVRLLRGIVVLELLPPRRVECLRLRVGREEHAGAKVVLRVLLLETRVVHAVEGHRGVVVRVHIHAVAKVILRVLALEAGVKDTVEGHRRVNLLGALATEIHVGAKVVGIVAAREFIRRAAYVLDLRAE